MPKHAKDKFVRDESSSGRLQIQPHDLALLKDVSEYRLMNTEQIASLHHRGLRNLQRRLYKLFHAGYLSRPKQQETQLLFSGSMVYGIGTRAVEVLYAGAERREKLAQIRIDEKTTLPHISHTLMISRFRALVSLAFEKERDSSLVRWEDAHALKALLAPRGGRAELVPDGFFIIKTPRGKLGYFLEADRASEWKGTFLEKMKIYREWYRTESCREKIGIAKFQVLTITESAKRRDVLRKITKQTDPKKEGSLIFLFATEHEFSLVRPDSLFAPIWLSPKNEEKLTLIP
jgi:hypothetical protein